MLGTSVRAGSLSASAGSGSVGTAAAPVVVGAALVDRRHQVVGLTVVVVTAASPTVPPRPATATSATTERRAITAPITAVGVRGRRRLGAGVLIARRPYRTTPTATKAPRPAGSSNACASTLGYAWRRPPGRERRPSPPTPDRPTATSSSIPQRCRNCACVATVSAAGELVEGDLGGDVLGSRRGQVVVAAAMATVGPQPLTPRAHRQRCRGRLGRSRRRAPGRAAAGRGLRRPRRRRRRATAPGSRAAATAAGPAAVSRTAPTAPRRTCRRHRRPRTPRAMLRRTRTGGTGGCRAARWRERHRRSGRRGGRLAIRPSAGWRSRCGADNSTAT